MYVDGTARFLRDDTVEHFVEQMLDKSDILTFEHPVRCDILDEAEFCESVAKYDGVPMRKQAESYFKE
jgi:hypothetical protein